MEKLKELRVKIEEWLEELESETNNRHMNDIEWSKYNTLINVLDMIDEMQ